MLREGGSNLESRSNLSAVPTSGRPSEVLVVLGGEVDYFTLVDGDGGLAGDFVPLRFDMLELRDVEAEYFPCLCLIQRGVVQGEMNTRLESLVDCSHSICGEEQEPVVVLKYSQENRYQSVSLHVGLGTLREEYIRLI